MNVNQMKAARQLVFTQVREYIEVHKLTAPINGYGIDMFAAVKVIVRGQRLYQMAEPVVHLNLKIDGRPFWGNFIVWSCWLLL